MNIQISYSVIFFSLLKNFYFLLYKSCEEKTEIRDFLQYENSEIKKFEVLIFLELFAKYGLNIRKVIRREKNSNFVIINEKYCLNLQKRVENYLKERQKLSKNITRKNLKNIIILLRYIICYYLL